MIYYSHNSLSVTVRFINMIDSNCSTVEKSTDLFAFLKKRELVNMLISAASTLARASAWSCQTNKFVRDVEIRVKQHK